MLPERLVRFPVRTVLGVLGLALAVIVLLEILLLARQVLTWILISLFFALALNPAVDWLQHHGVRRRGLATGITYLGALGAIAALVATFIPILVDQVNNFVNQVPEYVEELTR